jgi:DNA-directed RNA polymerase alpha subunit
MSNQQPIPLKEVITIKPEYLEIQIEYIMRNFLCNEDKGLEQRMINALKRQNLITFVELVDMTASDICRIRNFGKTCQDALYRLLERVSMINENAAPEEKNTN